VIAVFDGELRVMDEEAGRTTSGADRRRNTWGDCDASDDKILSLDFDGEGGL